MRALPAITLLLLACGACKSPDGPGAPAAPPERTSELQALFPAPKAGLAIRVGPEPYTLAMLADEFSRATGWTLIVDAETRRELEAAPTVTDRDLEVAPANVHAFVETLLAEHGYALSVASDRAPRLLRLQTAQGPRAANLRSGAPLVLGAELDAWADEHPAFLVRTLVVLEHLDARALANSYRSQMVDGNTQEVLALGDPGQMLVVGFAPWVRRVRDEFLLLDRTESRRGEAAPASAPHAAAPPER